MYKYSRTFFDYVTFQHKHKLNISIDQRRKVRVFAGIEESRGWLIHGELSPRPQHNSIFYYDIPFIGLVLQSRARLREFGDVNLNPDYSQPSPC